MSDRPKNRPFGINYFWDGPAIFLCCLRRRCGRACVRLHCGMAGKANRGGRGGGGRGEVVLFVVVSGELGIFQCCEPGRGEIRLPGKWGAVGSYVRARRAAAQVAMPVSGGMARLPFFSYSAAIRASSSESDGLAQTNAAPPFGLDGEQPRRRKSDFLRIWRLTRTVIFRMGDDPLGARLNVRAVAAVALMARRAVLISYPWPCPDG